MHNGLTAAHETHPYFHGEKVAFGLLVQLVLEGASRATVDEVLGFSAGVGLPITLADIGLHELPRDRLEPIAHRATAPGETIHNEPFEVTPEWSPMRSWPPTHSDGSGRNTMNQNRPDGRLLVSEYVRAWYARNPTSPRAHPSVHIWR